MPASRSRPNAATAASHMAACFLARDAAKELFLTQAASTFRKHLASSGASSIESSSTCPLTSSALRASSVVATGGLAGKNGLKRSPAT